MDTIITVIIFSHGRRFPILHSLLLVLLLFPFRIEYKICYYYCARLSNVYKVGKNRDVNFRRNHISRDILYWLGNPFKQCFFLQKKSNSKLHTSLLTLYTLPTTISSGSCRESAVAAHSHFCFSVQFYEPFEDILYHP